MLGLFDKFFEDSKKGRSVSKKPKIPDKISLAQFLGKYAYKEDVQAILLKLDLPTSGVKEDLIKRIMKAAKQLPPDQILDMLYKDSLKDACSDYDLQVSGNKSDLVDRVVNNIIIKDNEMSFDFNVPSLIDAGTKTSPAKSKKEKEKLSNVDVDQAEPLLSVLNWFSKTDIERGLKDQGLSISGAKDAMINRLLLATSSDPKKTLMSLDGQMLNAYAEKNNIPRRRSKEDQVNEILKAKSLIIDEVKNNGVRQHSTRVETPITTISQTYHNIEKNQRDMDFERVVRAVHDWIPQISHPTEDGYRTALNAELQFRHNFPTELESGPTRADLLVMRKIPIEMKKSPNKPDYDRCFGQLLEHLDAYGNVIVVFCAIKQLDDFNRFKDKVSKYVGDRISSVEIIRKNA